MASPNPIDLCVVDDVATWGNMPSALSSAPGGGDATMRTVIQQTITGWSEFVNWYCGRDPGYFTGNGSGDFQTFNEVRDGSDGNSMGVMNGPIASIISVQVNDYVYAASNAWNVLGFFIEQNPSFIGLRRGSGFLAGFAGFYGGGQGYFISGKGNVLLSYKGGYKSTPPDLFEKTLRACNVIVSKRLREDEGARTTPQTGAISNYRAFPWDKDIIQTLVNYRRTILTYGGGSY